jgi:hypothetical protein
MARVIKSSALTMEMGLEVGVVEAVAEVVEHAVTTPLLEHALNLFANHR